MSAVEWLKFILFFFCLSCFFSLLWLSFSLSRNPRDLCEIRERRLIFKSIFRFRSFTSPISMELFGISGISIELLLRKMMGVRKRRLPFPWLSFFFFRFICFLLARHSLMKFPKESLNDDERFFLGFTYDSRIYWSGIEDVLVS